MKSNRRSPQLEYVVARTAKRLRRQSKIMFDHNAKDTTMKTTVLIASPTELRCIRTALPLGWFCTLNIANLSEKDVHLYARIEIGTVKEMKPLELEVLVKQEEQILRPKWNSQDHSVDEQQFEQVLEGGPKEACSCI
eukprot:TRINITY_DN4479_c1_g1_i1.p1 TRINITY_DN4479_c1_g1~~TRINITY_DN4479_c1_g1_i1.p1  ORF type:complete len:137 (+),score=20.59 TRINITY_DN4479_c1_g1_i1:91-501(+)